MTCSSAYLVVMLINGNESMTPFDTKKRLPTRPLDGSRRSHLDRRSGEDRRQSYSLDYFLNGGIERRKGGERRKNGERRADWRQVDKWYSVFCGDDLNQSGCR